MRRIVVTGATGMIGIALIRERLKAGDEVYAIIRPASPRISLLPAAERLHTVECDLNALECLPDLMPYPCDVFYHLGWVHANYDSIEKERYYRGSNDGDILSQVRNIRNTVEAIRAAKALKCGLFVGAGSQAEFGPLNVEQIPPDAPANPRTPYGIAKYAAGKFARIEGERLGIPCVWVRIFSVYGYHNRKSMLMGSVIEKMRRGEHLSMTAGIQQWDYLFCEDAGRALSLIGEKCKSSAVYCLGSGRKRPLREYVEFLSRELGYEQEIGWGEIPYHPESVMNLCADISALTRDTGFTPQVSFEEGAQRLLHDKESPPSAPSGGGV